MKKEMAFNLLSLIAIGAFAVGFPGIGLAEVNAAGGQCHKDNTKQNIKKVTKDVAGEDALAIFVLKANGDIEVMEGPKISFRKPKKKGEEPIDQQPPSSESIDRDQIPLALEDDISASTVKRGSITTYVGNTCTIINGKEYCW